MDQERRDLDRLFSLAYEELKRLAGQVRAGEGSETLNPTVLVHEAWLRMANAPELGSLPPAHFKRIAARAMRQVLVDAARRRNAEKRGAGVGVVTFDDSLGGRGNPIHDLLALDQAMNDLARLSPRQASLVEARFFAGLEIHEVAQGLGVSEATAHRDWRAARAWLASRLREEE